MKKNFRVFALLFATLLVGLTACNKQEGPNTPGKTGEYSYAVLTINLPDGTNRGVSDKNHGDLYEGTVAEGKVSSVLVGFYDNDICVARVALNATADGTNAFTGADAANTSTKSKLVTKAVEIPGKKTTATYDVVVFFNPTEEAAQRIQKGNNIADLNRASNYAKDKIVTSNGIMMSNAKGLVKITADQLFDTAAEAEAAAATKAVNVSVERAVAKVFVNPTLGATGGILSNATAKLEGWQLDVTNKKLFNIRQMDQAIKTDSSNPATEATLEAETASSTRISSYAKDPNFDGAGTDIDETNYNYLAKDTNTVTFYEAGYDDDKGQYVAENTMSAVAQRHRASTLAVFKITITPKDITGSYVVYGNVPYTVEKFKEMIDKSEAGKTDDEIGMPTGFGDAVKAFSYNNQTGADGLKAALDAGEAFKVGNFSFYKDGINYYHMPIRHFTNEQQAKPMAYGRYGIVRNNIYKLTVNSIKNFGDPIIVEPGDEPDDKETAFISMSVELLPWLVRESSYNL